MKLSLLPAQVSDPHGASVNKIAGVDIDMEEKEEEDKLLLDSLGVTSADPEEIEHCILTEV